MKSIFVVVALLAVQPAFAQVRFISEPRKQALVPVKVLAPGLGYEVAAAQALKFKLPLVVFVGCPAHGDEWWFTAQVTTEEWRRLTGETIKGIVPSWPKGDWLERGNTLPATAGWNEITREFGSMKGVRPAPRPFYRLELLYGEATHDGESLAAGPWPLGVPFIHGLVSYQPAQMTQQSFNRSGRGMNAVISRLALPSKWHQPGGMEGIQDYRSDLYKLRSNRVTNWFGHRDPNDSPAMGVWGSEIIHQRKYDDGALFVDVLSHKGKVFELRAREKAGGAWHSYVAFRDKTARPPGYVGLRGVQCASCHEEAGTGGYGVGLVPGGDSVLSDPLPLEQ